MVMCDKNSALSLGIMTIDKHSVLWYAYIIKERNTKAAGEAESPQNHEPYAREDVPTAERTIAGPLWLKLRKAVRYDRTGIVLLARPGYRRNGMQFAGNDTRPAEGMEAEMSGICGQSKPVRI